jgi:hypothetical protein
MKTIYITKENYKTVKPSLFIYSFLEDLEMGIRLQKETGKEINMLTYIENKECLPCLGGLACMGMGIEYKYSEFNSLACKVAALGDSIRRGDAYDITQWLRDLYPEYKYVNLPQVYSIYSSDSISLEQLKKRIIKYSKLIEASGQ